MYKGMAEFDFEDFEIANYIFNDIESYFDYSELDPFVNLSLYDFDDTFFPVLHKYGFEDLTWEDIENNDELYDLIKDMFSDAYYEAQYAGLSEGHTREYVKTFNEKFISDFLKLEDVYDYIHNVKATMDVDEGVFRIEYEYDDDSVLEYYEIDEGEEEDYYFKHKERYHSDFEDDIRSDLENVIQDFDKYMGDIFTENRWTWLMGPRYLDRETMEKVFDKVFGELIVENMDKLKELIYDE
jgi:hypothetical protein